MKAVRAMIATVALAAPVVLATDPAWAAAPANDVLTGATPLALGSSLTADTSEATTDADDAMANETCGAPSTDASVWYSYTPAADGAVVVNVASSSYSAGAIIATGGPGSLTTIACGPGAVLFDATAGTTYSILAFDDQFDGGGNGGTLRISLSVGPPAPTLAVTVSPSGQVKNGTATLSGTFTCTDADFLDLFGRLTQRVGRGTVEGQFFFSSVGQCDGTPQPWTAQVPAQNGKFAGGKSAAVTFSFGCGTFRCAEGFTEQVVQLRGGKG